MSLIFTKSAGGRGRVARNSRWKGSAVSGPGISRNRKLRGSSEKGSCHFTSVRALLITH